MLKLNFRSLLIYIIISMYTLFISILYIDKLGSKYTDILNPLAWLFIFIITLYLHWNSNKRIKGKKDKAQTVFIIILFYLIMYFISGLFFGYSRSPLSHEPVYLLKNIWTFLIIVILQEYVRFSLLNSNKRSKLFIISITLVFILININFINFQNNFISGESTFKYISSTIVPVISQNILFTYLSIKCGYESVLAYRLPIIL